MARALFAVSGLLMLCLLILGLVVYLSRSEDQLAVDNQLAEDITRQISLSEDLRQDVDLRRLARFEWDRVLVVAPGTPAADVSRALGSEYKTDLPLPAANPVFVFARGRSLAGVADYRGRGTFAGFEEPVDTLQRPAAVLRVRDLVVSPA